MLVYTRSQGFEHSTVKRKGTNLSLAEQTVTDIGAKHGINVTYEKDGRLHHARGKAVVMCSGGWVNRRILADMPEDIKAAYAEFIHAPALVINVALTNWMALYDHGVTSLRWFDDDNLLGFVGNIRAPMVLEGATPPLDPAKLMKLMGGKQSSYKLSPDMRLTRRSKEAEAFTSGLEAADKVLSELSGCLKDAA